MARTKVFSNDSEKVVDNADKVDGIINNVITSKASTFDNDKKIDIVFGYNQNLVSLINKLAESNGVKNNKELVNLCISCHNSANKYGSRNLYASFEWFFNNYVDLIKE